MGKDDRSARSRRILEGFLRRGQRYGCLPTVPRGDFYGDATNFFVCYARCCALRRRLSDGIFDSQDRAKALPKAKRMGFTLMCDCYFGICDWKFDQSMGIKEWIGLQEKRAASVFRKRCGSFFMFLWFKEGIPPIVQFLLLPKIVLHQWCVGFCCL